MTEFDTLIENARNHCLSLDEGLHQQALALDEAERALTRFQTEIEAENEALDNRVSQEGTASQDRHQADDEGCQRLLAFLEELQSRLQSLEDRLRGDLEAIPGALTNLRQQALAAVPALTEAATLLHTRVSELDSEVDQALEALQEDMSGLEKQVGTLQESALQQKAALQKQLSDFLISGEALQTDGSKAALMLFERMLEADTQVSGVALASQDTLLQAGQSASAGLREQQRALAAQLASDTLKIQESVLEVERSCGHAMGKTRERSQALHSDLTELCRNLEPLLRLQQDARNTGAL